MKVRQSELLLAGWIQARNDGVHLAHLNLHPLRDARDTIRLQKCIKKNIMKAHASQEAIIMHSRYLMLFVSLK